MVQVCIPCDAHVDTHTSLELKHYTRVESGREKVFRG